MAVKAGELENPERGMGELTTRKEPPDELKALRGRIAGARNIKPPRLHCSHCVQAFVEGRDAAVKAIDG